MGSECCSIEKKRETRDANTLQNEATSEEGLQDMAMEGGQYAPTLGDEQMYDTEFMAQGKFYESSQLRDKQDYEVESPIQGNGDIGGTSMYKNKRPKIKHVPCHEQQLLAIETFLTESIIKAEEPLVDSTPEQNVQPQPMEKPKNRLLEMLDQRRMQAQNQRAIITEVSQGEQQLPFKFVNYQAQRNAERGIRSEVAEQTFVAEKSISKGADLGQTSLRMQADRTAVSTMMGQSSRALFDDDDSVSMNLAGSDIISFDKGTAPVAHHNHILLSTQLDSITSFLANSSADLSQDNDRKVAFEQYSRIQESGTQQQFGHFQAKNSARTQMLMDRLKNIQQKPTILQPAAQAITQNEAE